MARHDGENGADRGRTGVGDGRPADGPMDLDDTLIESGAPTDLSALQADDALLDMLGGTDPALTGRLAEQELSALLLSWRRDVDAEPIDELVDTDTALAVVAAARAPRRRHRLLVPLASAAAVLAIAFTGVGMVARDAQPGDALWGLTRVLYSDHARSVEAAASVKADLEQARTLLANGRIAEARALLDRAETQIGEVNNEDGKRDLMATHGTLLHAINTGQLLPPDSSTADSSKQAKPPTSSGDTATSQPSTSRNPQPPPATSTTPVSPSDPSKPTGSTPSTTPGSSGSKDGGTSDGSRSSHGESGQSDPADGGGR
ncbi:hypothetical protein GCM10012275_32280 [Longimycelium tulufanense]|uniref:Anti-sigma-D factor RsdA sigma factor binding region domain-containing protein n=1 Tax=Longimycelium tulufanense TaxID=907463 RepID=A0A8J3CFN9_9PSEU|nr:anti-sigma-D factor RsdA [Longimycelium tulufanense]GGM58650.1 hypothetical protein GCM10012275_32280 [Longimycelium tulufanense]